jgi:hypothetical protein
MIDLRLSHRNVFYFMLRTPTHGKIPFKSFKKIK